MADIGRSIFHSWLHVAFQSTGHRLVGGGRVHQSLRWWRGDRLKLHSPPIRYNKNIINISSFRWSNSIGFLMDDWMISTYCLVWSDLFMPLPLSSLLNYHLATSWREHLSARTKTIANNWTVDSLIWYDLMSACVFDFWRFKNLKLVLSLNCRWEWSVPSPRRRGPWEGLARSLRAMGQATGGGEPCPSSTGLTKVEQCNMKPCPLARLDRALDALFW